MKKRYLVSVIAACTAAFCLPAMSAHAEEAAFADAGALVQSWGEEYPDYVCGIWSENGDLSQLVIGILPGEAGEKGRQTVLEQIENDDSVRFVTQQHSHTELSCIMEKLTAYMQEQKVPDLYACALDDQDNCIRAEVNLENPSPALKDFMAWCTEQYGDAVVYEQGSPVTASVEVDSVVMDGAAEEQIICGETPVEPVMEIGADAEYSGSDDTITIGAVMTDGEGKPLPNHNRHDQPVIAKPSLQNTEQSSSYTRLLWVVSAAVVLAAAGAVVFGVMRHRSAARQTSAGTVVTGGESSRKQTERLVREQAPELPDGLKDRIMQKAKQKQE